MKIIIEFSDKGFYLRGNINEFNSFIKVFLNGNFKKVIYNSNLAEVECCNEDRDLAIKKLIKLFEKYGIEYSFSQDVKKRYNNVLIEEENFKKFSLKAKNIRNNICDPTEFKFFSDTLESKMLNRKLYPLQLLSSYHLAFSQNACNFSVPGSGKTSIVYGAYTYLKNLDAENSKHVDYLLIIGPLSSFGPWEDEYRECFGKKADVKRLIGGITLKERSEYLQGYRQSEITLTSYQTATNCIEDLEVFLKNKKVMIVLDEAHKIKNTSGTPVASNILRLAKYATSRVILTGTPAPNGYEDLYNLYSFIWPTKNVLKFHLSQLISMTKDKNKNIEQLIENASPFFLRIKKSDFDNLPVPIENAPIIVKMDLKQREIYDFIEKNYVKQIQKSTNLDLSTLTKARIIRMMQAATNPHLLKLPVTEMMEETKELFIDDVDILKSISSYDEVPQKFIACLNLVKTILNREEKVIIWANFIININMLKELLDKNEIKSEILYGATPISIDEEDSEIMTREKIVREFNSNNSSFNVIIANPYAASESISLHKACHNAIYLERNFNATTYMQSKDRIHRYGLKKEDKINYYYLFSENSIDKIIHDRLNFKESRMKKIIESSDIPLFSNYYDLDFVSDDIKEIIKSYVNRKN